MGKKKKDKHSKILKIFYAICVIIVIIAGLYYENGYSDINKFINDLTGEFVTIGEIVSSNIKETLEEDNAKEHKDVKSKPVTGKLEMHMVDQTTPNMIQGLKGIFARKPLISIGI